MSTGAIRTFTTGDEVTAAPYHGEPYNGKVVATLVAGGSFGYAQSVRVADRHGEEEWVPSNRVLPKSTGQTEGCRRWGCWFGPSTGVCNRCTQIGPS